LSDWATASATEIDARAAAWIQQRDISDWGEGEQAEFNAWLSESLAHRAAYLRLEAVWQRTERLAALHALAEREEAAPARTDLFRLLTRLTAGLAIIVALSASVFLFLQQPHTKTYQTTVGGHETLTFRDGSQIELNTDTVVRAAMDAKQRTIWLDKGEAYFQIVHDSAHPLVVFAARRRVTDIGTKFVIRRDSDNVEVTLIEGRAKFDTPQDAASKDTMLKPGDVLSATANSVSLKRASVQALSDQLGWQRGILVFHHTTLGDAAAEFNRYNDRKLVVADSTVSRLTVVGTFRTNDLAGFIDVSQAVFGLHVVKRGNETVIAR
jgi:transmembrane sensor